MDNSKNDIFLNIYNTESNKVVYKSLEKIVKQLVASSMPLNFHIEALKCQSIIIRTKLIRHMKSYEQNEINNHKASCISLENIEDLIVLEGRKENFQDNYKDYEGKLDKAVKETEGKIIIFNNKPIDARFHMACGGATENSENVDGNVIRYLRKVLCNSCSKSPYSLNYKDIALESLEEGLNINLTNHDVLKDIPIYNIIDSTVRDQENRVIKIRIGNKEFKGKEIMDLLNIDSTRFGWRPQIIRFFTVGKGHGLGLCQHGANIMAEDGSTAETILKYYYTGIEIKTIKSPCINKPLKGKLIVIDPAHGGNSKEGHIGRLGLKEKDVNLSIALYLEGELKDLGAEVLLTRREDTDVPLNIRAEMTNKARPHFFISIHQNHFHHPSKAGTEIYYFRGDRPARGLAGEIMKTITGELKTLDRGIKSADFFLLRTVATSAIHVEVAYISNPEEEKMLMDETYKKKAAKAIASGIVNFYKYV